MKKLIAMVAMFAVVMSLVGCQYLLSGKDKNKATKPEATATEAPKDNTKKNDITGEIDMNNPIVTFTLENDMVINVELYPDKAPNTVNNFVSLVKSGYYDGLTFHRIIDGFMIQGGCPNGTGMGGPGYSIPGEFSQNGFKQNDIKHEPGVISMARSGMPDSAGSQFFLMVGNSPHLDGAYAAFGKTVDEESLKNCLELAKVEVRGDRPTQPPVIKSVIIDTKGIDYEAPNHS